LARWVSLSDIPGGVAQFLVTQPDRSSASRARVTPEQEAEVAVSFAGGGVEDPIMAAKG